MKALKLKMKQIKSKNMKKKVDRNNMIYYSNKKPFYFKMFKTIRSLGNDIYSGKITTNEAN